MRRSTLFERLPVAATIVDRFGHVRKANEEARRLAGASPDRTHGQTCKQYWHCRVPPGKCPLRRVLASDRPIYRTLVPVSGPREGCLIERVAMFGGSDGRRQAVILAGPATAFFKRMEELRRRARIDALTGVLNRGCFEALTLRAQRLERRRGPCAFVMMDIDRLKAVNDRFGHAAGDRLLSRLGLLLRGCARRSDVIGRLGGDEFAVYCPDNTRATATALVRRLKLSITRDNAANPEQPALSVQFGVAWTAHAAGGKLRERADRLLYAHKRQSRPAAP